MDNLFRGNLFPPPLSGSQIGRRFIQRRFVRSIPYSIPGQRDHHSGIRRFVNGIVPESRSPSSRNRDRFHPGTVIAFIPERRSARSGIRKHFGRNLHGLS